MPIHRYVTMNLAILRTYLIFVRCSIASKIKYFIRNKSNFWKKFYKNSEFLSLEIKLTWHPIFEPNL